MSSFAIGDSNCIDLQNFGFLIPKDSDLLSLNSHFYAIQLTNQIFTNKANFILLITFPVVFFPGFCFS